MMFEVDAPFVVIVIAIGLVIGFGLWAFRLIPWWGILIAGGLFPAILLALVLIVSAVLWMGSGSH